MPNNGNKKYSNLAEDFSGFITSGLYEVFGNKRGTVLKRVRRLARYQKKVLLTILRHTKNHQKGQPTGWFSFDSNFVSDEES